MRARRSALYCLLLLWASSCGGAPYSPPAPTSTSGQVYLDRLIDIMQANSVNRLRIDWTNFRAQVAAAAGGAATIAETFPAIGVALGMLDDHHSFYRRPDGINGISNPRFPAGCSVPAIATPSVPDDIGYVRITATSAQGNEQVVFAEAIQQQIRDRDRDNLAGWIVDLRGNGGGNMWPMVAGLGPVLGDGLLGYFFSPTGVETPWSYHDGASWIGSSVAQRVDAPYRLRKEQPRVAVIVDNLVASSGEATYISFRQRPETRSFGAATCGLSTSNSTFTLTDGATLTLTTTVMADRTRQAYGDRIAPDEIISEREQILPRAMAWLQTGR